MTNCIKYKDWCEEHKDQQDNPWTLANLDFGEIEYNKEKICELFDIWYGNFIIVDPMHDFAQELQLTYDMSKERIDSYYTAIDGFDGKDTTVMTVDYGARTNHQNDYEYPIAPNGVTPEPNYKRDNTQETFTDTTTVTKDPDPFKRLSKLRDNDTFIEFFVKQFDSCFTLCGGMTW